MSEVSAISAEQVRPKSGLNTPILTWVMSGLCILLTAAHHTSGNMPVDSFWYRMGHFGHLPATAIWSGQWPALFTTFFIHGDPARPWLTVAHLGFNLIVLIQAGRVLEATLHPVAYYLFFVAAAMVGSASELALTGSTGVGASGVVYAMFGLLWAGSKQDEEWADVANPLAIIFVVGWAVICVVLTQLHVIAIANAAHFGGLLFGLAVGWVFIARRYQVLGSFILAGLAAVVVLSLTWLPWSRYWTFWKGVQARNARQFDRSIEWFERSKKLGMDPEFVDGNEAATLYLEQHPESRGVMVVPEQPDRERFGNAPNGESAPPFLNVPQDNGDRQRTGP